MDIYIYIYIFKGFAPCRRPLMPIAVEVPAWGDLCPQICQKDRRYLLILFGEPHVVALGLFLPLLPLLGERSLVTSTGVFRIPVVSYGKTERVLSGDGSAWKILFIFPGLFFWRVVGFIFFMNLGSMLDLLWEVFGSKNRETQISERHAKTAQKNGCGPAQKSCCCWLAELNKARGGEGGPYKDTQPLSPKHIMNIAWRASGHGGGDHTVIISYFCEFVI